MSDWNITKEYLDQNKEIQRLRAHCKGLEAADEVRRERIAELEAKVQAQSEYIMTANRINNNLKKEIEEGD